MVVNSFYENSYIIIIGIFVFITYFIGGILKPNSKDEKIVYILMTIIFSLLLAYRPEMVPDTKSYKETFDIIQVGKNYGFNPFGEIYTVEYGFFYLMYLFKTIYNDIHFFYFFFNFIIILIFINSCKYLISQLYNIKEISVLTILAIYMAYFGTYYIGIAVREGMTISLLMLCLCKIEKKKYFQVLIIGIIGFLFHRLFVSTIAIFIIWFFGDIKFEKKKYLIVWSVCGGYLFLNNSISIQEKFLGLLWNILPKLGINYYMGYLEDYIISSYKKSFTIILLWLLIGIITIFYNEKHASFKIVNIIYCGLIISILLYTLKGSSRIYDFFTVFTIIPLSFARKKININSASVKQMGINVCIGFIILFQLILINRIVYG